MQNRLTAAVIVLVALALPGSAFAATEVEPNDGIEQADGPLTPGTNFDGKDASSGDVDWYLLYVTGPGALDIALTETTVSGGYVEASFYDQDGAYLNNAEASEDATDHIQYTTPGAGVYYVAVEGNTNSTYRLSATGPLTGGPRPAPGTGTPNGHATRVDAFGPLSGGTLYEGRIDASGEEDWFYFFTSGPGTFDVTLTNTGSYTEADLYDRDGDYLNGDDGGANTRSHMIYTANQPDAFYVQVRGNTESTYQLQITPAELLTSEVPPFLTDACKSAEAKVAKLKGKLAKAKEQRRAATTRKAKRKAAKKVKRLKKKVKKAKQRAKAVC